MDINDFILMYWQRIALAAILSGLAVMVWHRNRESVDLFFISFYHRLPLFGKISSLSKKPTITDDGWFHSEKQVCQDFKNHYMKSNRKSDYYTQCKDYLAIVGESDRKPLTFMWSMLLFTVLVIEAFGFSYTLSGFLDLSASENVRKYMAYGVSIMFAVFLELFTHQMGHEIYRNKVIDRIRALWKEDEDRSSLNTANGVGVGEIENPSDLNEKAYIQQLNRLKIGKNHKTYGWTVATIALIAVIAISISAVRWKAMELAQTTDSMCSSTQFSGQLEPEFGVSYDDVPAEVLERNSQVVAQGKSEMCSATEEGSLLTIWTLAIMFCALQTFATWVAINRGFVGGHSEKAYYATYKHETKDDYILFLEMKTQAVIDVAQRSLVLLQSKMASKLSKVTQSNDVTKLLDTSGSRTFFRYLEDDHKAQLRSALKKQINENQVNIEEQQEGVKHAAKTSEIEAERLTNEGQMKDEMKRRMAKIKAERDLKQAAPQETEIEKQNRLLDEMEEEQGFKFTPEERQMMLSGEA